MIQKLLKKYLYFFNYYGFVDSLNFLRSFLRLRYFLKKQRFIGNYILRNKKNIFLGNHIKAYPDLFIEAHEKGIIKIGEGCVFNRNAYISSFAEIYIGKYCLFGPNLYIGDHDHGIYSGENQSRPTEKPFDRCIHPKEIYIGDKVWIGGNVTITKGSYIGKGSVIGANSVVVGRIPENSLAVGSPAKVKKVYSFEKMKWIDCKKDA